MVSGLATFRARKVRDKLGLEIIKVRRLFKVSRLARLGAMGVKRL